MLMMVMVGLTILPCLKIDEIMHWKGFSQKTVEAVDSVTSLFMVPRFYCLSSILRSQKFILVVYHVFPIPCLSLSIILLCS